jgi:hypothetical protein
VGSTSKARKVVAVAMQRVVARNMAAGRSLAYEQLLAETAAEVDVLLDKRRECDVRLLRRARKQIVEDQVRLAAGAESRAAGDVERRQLAEFEMGPGVPTWHPEHDANDIM